MPAASNRAKVSSFARSPPERAAFSITRTSTPARCRSMTASDEAVSVKVNCLTSSDVCADSMKFANRRETVVGLDDQT